jgi:hypothetical protein
MTGEPPGAMPPWSHLDHAVEQLRGLLEALLQTQTSPAAQRLLDQWREPLRFPDGEGFLASVIDAKLHPAVTRTARDLRRGVAGLSDDPHNADLAEQIDHTAATVTADLERLRIEAAIRRTGIRLGQAIDDQLPNSTASLAVTWRDQPLYEAWTATFGPPAIRERSWVLDVVPAEDRATIQEVLEHLTRAREAFSDPHGWGDVRAALLNADRALRGRPSAQAPSTQVAPTGDVPSVGSHDQPSADVSPGVEPEPGSRPELR